MFQLFDMLFSVKALGLLFQGMKMKLLEFSFLLLALAAFVPLLMPVKCPRCQRKLYVKHDGNYRCKKCP